MIKLSFEVLEVTTIYTIIISNFHANYSFIGFRKLIFTMNHDNVISMLLKCY